MYQYQVSFGEAIKRGFANYSCFKGRASRSEFWFFQLFQFLVNIAIQFTTVATTMPLINNGGYYQHNLDLHQLIYPLAGYGVLMLYNIAMILPLLSLACRRLHDTGRSGLWLLLPFVISVLFFIPIIALGFIENKDLTTWLICIAVLYLSLLAVSILFLVWFCQPSQMHENEYGPVPNIENNDSNL